MEAGLFESLCLGGRQHAQGTAYFEAEGADLANHFQDGLEGGPLPHLPPSGPHTKAAGPYLFGLARRFEDFVEGHEFFHIVFAPVVYGLGAIGAVFGAAAGFNGEEAAQLDGMSGAEDGAV